MHPSPSLPDFPERPDDVPAEASAAAVPDAYERHLIVLAAARAGSPPLLPAWVVRHAVAALALSQTLVDALAGERWPIVRDGLAHGAAVAELGAAAGGLEADEVTAGLRSWADRMHRAGRLSDVEYDAVLELAAGGAR